MLGGARDRAQHSEGLVSYLPPVAVRAMQEIPPPPLANAGELRQLVTDAGSDQDPPRSKDATAGDAHGEAGFDRERLILDELDAVAGRLGTADGQQFCRRHPVAGEETLHVSRRSIPWGARVDDDDSPTRASEHECRAQACSAAADDRDVIVR